MEADLMNQKRLAKLIVVLCTAIPPAARAEIKYTITDLGSSEIGRVATAISADGHVTGYYQTNDYALSAFMYDGSMHPVVFDQGYIQAFAVNDSGHIAGQYLALAPGLGQGAFLYDGTLHDLGNFIAPGINNSGQIVVDDDQ